MKTPSDTPFPFDKGAKSGAEMPAGEPAEPPTDFVWSFRGYKLRSSEFTTAMVHFFRAEIHRANVWRTRLDATTNWAVVTTGAAISYAFTQTGNHVVILMNIILVTIFLLIEARRYRYYELWSYRVRLMETDFFAPMLVPPFHPAADWAEALSESLLHPNFPISALEAIGRRLRRNYLYIYGIVGAAWLAKLWLIPEPVISMDDLARRAAIGTVSGVVIFTIAIIFCIAVITLSILTVRLQESAGEVLPRFGSDFDSILFGAKGKDGKKHAWFRPSRRRSQLLTLIITDKQEAVSDRIIKDMGRGVTSLSGKGMYTGDSHPILLCALTVTEIPQLKSVVVEADPRAFVIVMPATEVLGYGFQPLEKDIR
jgi:uncharacterized membrane protein